MKKQSRQITQFVTNPHLQQNENAFNQKNNVEYLYQATNIHTIIDIPRDREGEFKPLLIPKGVSRFAGFDEKVISLYARGITMSETQGHLEEIYQTEISKDLISMITDGVIDEAIKWQNRPLDN